MRFKRYIGIDYSGAKTPTSRLAGLQVYTATRGGEPVRVVSGSTTGRKWTRKEIAHWLAEQLAGDGPILVGIDHAFSFPVSYLDRHQLGSWDAFLDDFCLHWPTHEDDCSVESLRKDNPRNGTEEDKLRLTEKWTSSAKSVFLFDCQGSVAKSTHSGVPWLGDLRHQLMGRVHFWPFDGFAVPEGKSVIAEVYPSIFRNRYPRESPSGDEHDAYAVTRWMKEMDEANALGRYFEPPLSETDHRLARREGWILGVA